MISFIITFNIKRIDNLEQTIRFLEKREKIITSCELILCCQHYCKPLNTKFKTTKSINLYNNSFIKSKMLNTSVNQATNDVIVILDSDRILPKNYFTNIYNQLKSNEILSTQYLYSLERPYTDIEIESNNIIKKPDFRYSDNKNRQKSLFSGNTMMWKSDYLKIGGYDENFIGYGFEDNDMTRNALTNGLNFKLLNYEELHLNHELRFYWNNDYINLNDGHIIFAANALRYCNKWDLLIDPAIQSILDEANNRLSLFKQELIEPYIQQVKIYNEKHNLPINKYF